MSSVQARGQVSPRAGNLGYCLGAVRCRAVTCDRGARFNRRSGRTCYCSLELQTNRREDFTITWFLKVPSSAFTFIYAMLNMHLNTVSRHEIGMTDGMHHHQKLLNVFLIFFPLRSVALLVVRTLIVWLQGCRAI